MYVYAVETPGYVKIGHWSGSISALQARYATSIPFFETTVFQTSHSVEAEKKLHRECQPFHLRGEMFSLDALPVFYSAAASLGEIYCTSTDLEKKKTACLKAQSKKLAKEIAVLRKANEKLTTENSRLIRVVVDIRKINSDHIDENLTLKRKIEEIEPALQEQRDEKSPFDVWLDDHLIAAPDARIHVHRFERAYNAGKQEADRIRISLVIRKLTERGHIVSGPKDKQKDPGCCVGSLRWVKHINVLG